VPFRSLLIILLFFIYAKADFNITQNWLKTKPRSYAKDFYILRYLKQNITPSEAIWALGEAKNVNNKLFFAYAKKLKDKGTSQVVKCIKLPAHKLVKTSAQCIELGLTAYKATKLSHKELNIVINKLKTKYPTDAQKFAILNSIIPFELLIHAPNQVFFDTFNQCGGKFRTKYFNHPLPLKVIKQLRKDKKNFATVIKKVVTNPNFTELQNSFLFINPKGLSHQSIFFLAINAIKHNQIKQALYYLEFASKTAYFKFDKDKVLFWQYKLTNNKKYLEKLSQSWDINLYSLIAKEKLNIPIDNIIYDINNTNQTQSTYNIKDPFSWLRVLHKTKKLDKQKLIQYKQLFNTEETKGHLAFLYEKFYHYKKAYFINPYKQYIKNYSKDRQALINAIARQESRFIPTSISPSYALGVMQIMPFLSKELAKQLHEHYDIDKQLTAKTNIKYANKHLNYLEKHLNNILFIAYAYNGGIGFTKRMLKNGFFQKGKYEPFLSMELVPYNESKRYGKKVLLNYIIYKNYFNNQQTTKITKYLQNLM